MGRRRKKPIFAASCQRCGRGIEAGQRASMVTSGKLTDKLDIEKADPPRYLHRDCMEGLLDPRGAALKAIKALAANVPAPATDPED